MPVFVVVGRLVVVVVIPVVVLSLLRLPERQVVLHKSDLVSVL